jgi:hypothetical protein
VAWRIGPEIEKGDGAIDRLVLRSAKGVAEVSIPPNADIQIRGVVQFLEDGVDEIAVRIEEEDVVVC